MMPPKNGPIDCVRVVVGSDAESLLADERFVTCWQKRYDACPWATVYQSPGFVCTWYGHYRSVFDPVLVVGGGDEPESILCLARDKESGALHSAGTHHAEYHAWVSFKTDGAFMSDALSALEGRFPRFTLRFKYAPKGMPLGWTTSGGMATRIVVEEVSRPLLRVADADRLDRFIRGKKRMRTKLNRLRRMGALEYRRVRSRAELEPHIDAIATWCDLRHGAIHGACPFSADPRKRDFHLALLDLGLLQAGMYFLDGELIAAHLGGCGRGHGHLGVIVHSPRLGKHSPGAHLIFEIARELAAESFAAFDLTPGGDEYKARFATEHDTVHVIEVRPSATAVAIDAARARAGKWTCALIAKTGMEPRALREKMQGLLRRNWRRAPRVALGALRHWIGSQAEFRVYRLRPSEIPHDCDTRVTRDRYEDLLQFRPRFRYQDYSEFLRSASRRLENGNHCYTAAEDGVLLHFGWLVPRQKRSHFSEVDHEFEYPDNSATLFDFYSDPAARGRGLYQSALKRMLVDAAAIPGTEHIFISVLADNGPSRHVIEKVGFRYYASVSRKIRFGRATHSLTYDESAEK